MGAEIKIMERRRFKIHGWYRCSNISLKALPDGQKWENWGKRQHLKKYYAKIFQNFKDPPGCKINRRWNIYKHLPHRYTLIKHMNIKNKEKILKAITVKRKITYKEVRIKLTSDSTWATRIQEDSRIISSKF